MGNLKPFLRSILGKLVQSLFTTQLVIRDSGLYMGQMKVSPKTTLPNRRGSAITNNELYGYLVDGLGKNNSFLKGTIM